MLMRAKVAIQVAGIVAGASQSSLARCLEHALAFTVLLGLIVLLSIFDEPPPAAVGPARSMVLEPLVARRLGRARFELLDVASVSLRSVAAFRLRRAAMRAFSWGTTFYQGSPPVTGLQSTRHL
jgi:hypothetical protein